MKIILFGGSFNPPHLGHQQMVNEVLKAGLADQVWYLPVGIHDFGKKIVGALERQQMLELLLPEADEVFHAQIKVEACELRRPGISHSADTLDYLSARHPQHQFSFLIGSDNLEKLHLWQDQKGRDFYYLLNHYPVYVYPRVNFTFKPFYDGLIALKNLPEVEISSTQVRAALMSGAKQEELLKFLDPKIIKYISEKGLYGQS